MSCRGSSPRAGRRRHALATAGARQGLIPASGETTGASRRGRTAGTAHPRERGDDPAGTTAPKRCTGSSPRAGRRRASAHAVAAGVRLIPASGETTWRRSPTGTRWRAHPRERGDDLSGAGLASTTPGSSPRAGRRREHPARRAGRDRLIPASGETTTRPSTCPRPWRAHPRERGDDASSSASGQVACGSSPRAGRRR